MSFLVNGIPFEQLPPTSVAPTGYDGSNEPYWDTADGHRIRDVRENVALAGAYAGISGDIPWTTGGGYDGFMESHANSAQPQVHYSVPSSGDVPFDMSAIGSGDMPFEFTGFLGGDHVRTGAIPVTTPPTPGGVLKSSTADGGVNWGLLLVISIIVWAFTQE